MAKEAGFNEARHTTTENLRAIQDSLNRCIEEGMIDEQAEHYNEVLALLDEASIAKTWDELEEVIEQAKVLEIDVAVWLSAHGRTSFSIPWPKVP